MSNNGGFLKRLEQLSRTLRLRGKRTIVVKVPTLLTPVEGSVECASTVVPEVQEAVNEILTAVGFVEEDTVIEIAHCYQQTKTNGKSEPVPTPAPELISVT